MPEDKRKDTFNGFGKKEMIAKNTEELSGNRYENPSQDFFILKVRYRCADCDWSSPWGGRSQLKASLENHTRETGHEYFFSDSSKEG